VLKKPLTKRQESRYDRVCEDVRIRFGSYESIARQAFVLSNEEVAGNTVRVWFQDRKIPTDFCFILYEMMGHTFRLCDLLPWLEQYLVEYHQQAGEKK
jgi:hypothetical protein